MMTLDGPTRTRRIATCWGDGAKAIPIDPEFICWAGAGAYELHTDGEEIVARHRGPWARPQVVGRVCWARATPLTPPGSVQCNSGAPEPWGTPVDQPRAPYLLAHARALAEMVAAAEAELSVEILGFDEHRFGERARLALVHEQGGRGAFSLVRAWGEVFAQDFEGIPPAAVEFVMMAWEAVQRG